MKTLSKTNVEISVKSLRAPKIKTDIQSVDTLRITAKTGNVPATRQERKDHLTFKSSKSARDVKHEQQDEQIRNCKQAYDKANKLWHQDYMHGKVSGIHETLHQTGLGNTRVDTIKFHDITNGIANLYDGKQNRIQKHHSHQDFNKNLNDFQGDQISKIKKNNQLDRDKINLNLDNVIAKKISIVSSQDKIP